MSLTFYLKMQDLRLGNGLSSVNEGDTALVCDKLRNIFVFLFFWLDKLPGVLIMTLVFMWNTFLIFIVVFVRRKYIILFITLIKLLSWYHKDLVLRPYPFTSLSPSLLS